MELEGFGEGLEMECGKFFGAFRAYSGISDAVIINHTPVGCNWGAGLFKTVSNQPDIRHACTVMHEREIVFGGEESLRSALIRADKLYSGSIFLVIAGDVPSIIGDDIEAVINSVSLSRPVVWTEAAGFKGSMRDGYEGALLSLAPLITEPDTVERSVNIIGFCPDDFKAEADIKEIKRLMKMAGLEVNCVISSCSFDEFAKASSAELNIVIGQGTGLARYMETEIGLPFIDVGYPYGIDGTKKFLDSVSDQMGAGYDFEENLDLDPFKRVYLDLNELWGIPVSVIGDFRATKMEAFLDQELGFEIEVSSSFEGDPYVFEQDVKKSSSTMIFGSSLERNIADDLGIPLIRYCYPVLDQVCIYNDAPYAGLRGAIYLTETIINAVMGFEDKFRDGFII